MFTRTLESCSPETPARPMPVASQVRVVAFLAVLSVFAAEPPALANGSIQGLDQQVQEIKTDVLSIANELRQLEEKLLYPSDTQLAVFFSVADAGDVEIDSLDVEIDGEAVAHHVYSFKELEALKKGGVQRLYTGNVRPGEHEIRVALSGQRAGSSFERTHLAVFTKLRPPKIVEFELLGSELGARRIAADGS